MTTLGRAELLRAFAEGGEGGLTSMARLLGYEERRPESAQRRTEARSVVEPQRPVAKAEDAPLAPIPFWYLDEVEHFETEPAPAEPPPTVRPIGLAGLERRPGKPPPTQPLAPASRLAPALRQRLASDVPSRELDADALAEHWSRGRILRELPFRPLAAWSPTVVVLVDRSARLIPFWDDQDRVLAWLRRRLGPAAVHEVRFVAGSGTPWHDGRRHYRRPPVASGAAVLVLGDLGFLGGDAERALWRSLGERFERSAVQRAALVACPASRWTAEVARFWEACEWERPAGAPRRGQAPDDARRRARAERLLALLAFASRIEPGLLRAVRRLLPAGEADAGTEADAWAHPEVAAGFAPAGALGADLRDRLQARFAGESNELKQGVVTALRSFRAGLPEEIWLDEVLGLAAAGALPDGVLRSEEIAAARTLWQRVAATVDTPAPPKVARAVKAFVRRSLGERQPEAVWRDQDLKQVLWRAWEATWDGEAPLPAGVGPEVKGGARGAVRRWQAWQVGGELRFLPVGETPTAGSPLFVFESSLEEIGLHVEGARVGTLHPLSRSVPFPEASSFVLRSDRERVVLRRMERPAWASVMGRDRFGLWASFEVEGVVQRLRYILPGRFMMGSPEDEPGRFGDEGPRHLEIIAHGFWLADTPCTQALWQAVMGDNPSRFQSRDRPVETVSNAGCQSFFRRLEVLIPGLAARLPTEAEWEYACRAGTETATYAGHIEILGSRNAPILDNIAWYAGNSGKDFDLSEGDDSSDWPEKQYPHTMAGTRPVAQKAPNPWGLYDMLGNVYEWCQDFWRDRYDTQPRNISRLARGGSWGADARYVRAAYRLGYRPTIRWNDQGFRLARGQSALMTGAKPQSAERYRGGAVVYDQERF